MVAPITIGLVGINVAIFYCSASETPHETFFFLISNTSPHLPWLHKHSNHCFQWTRRFFLNSIQIEERDLISTLLTFVGEEGAFMVVALI